MRALSISLIVASIGMVAGSWPSVAAGSPETRGIGGATGRARVLALVEQYGTVIRSKGVLAVTHPTVGLYCIKPEVSNPNTSLAFVTVAWEHSLGNNMLAVWGSKGTGCPAGEYAVRTFYLSSGTFIPANNVGFSFFVP